jgi:hypothetical protein
VILIPPENSDLIFYICYFHLFICMFVILIFVCFVLSCFLFFYFVFVFPVSFWDYDLLSVTKAYI